MPAQPRLQRNLVSILLIALVGMNGLVLLRDLFSIYVFLEVTSVASFVLIGLMRGREALEGAFKYIILSAVASVLMLIGVSVVLVVAGGTDFESIAQGLRAGQSPLLAKLAVASFVCGLFIKGGLVPFHGWVVGAYSAAPAPVSIFLAGIATKVSGIYLLIRLAGYVFPPSAPLNHVLLALGAVSVVVGALAAMTQKDMKRLLAYSSISQVGYIILGLGCGSPLGLAGAVFHLFNHAVFKSLLFANAAALEHRLGTTDMDRMGGLGSRMPVTGLTSVIGLLSTAGEPPLSGFWSKLIVVVALWQGGFHGYAGLAVLMSGFTLAYLLVMQRRVFFGLTPPALADVQEESLGLVLPAVVLAILTVGLGLAAPLLFRTFLLPVRGLG